MSKTGKFQKEKLKKGIYILPNFFTSMNLFCGFFSIIASIDNDFVKASYAILIAVIFDSIDGKVARVTNTASKFGIEYDSLADLISFGLASGLMIYLWALKPMELGRLGWLAGFMFVICGALRLARFNTCAEETPNAFFIGLPIPAAAAMTATTVLFFDRFNIDPKPNAFIMMIMLYCLAFFMVSTIKFNSFKKAALFNRMKLNVFVGIIVIFIFIVASPSTVLFVMMLLYILSGPVGIVWRLKQNKDKNTE
ncbi:MAG: CDP-diacylglycerol--serine O-phosphatidyltransferase [Desulfobacteraceae bacterium 4572_19]|nr:MAG: CDP-diacylglycerol--serine O-phosphatidyltransferase [Desulfobacteraceae bacterium 4572_19]